MTTTESKWEQKIIDIIAKVNQEFPELSKFITEIPISVSEKSKAGINIKNLEEYYNSLVEIVNTYSKTHTIAKAKKAELSAYPLYSASEDIYEKGKVEREIDPENISKNKTLNENEGTTNEKNFQEDMSGDDLDVPGSELDNQQESVGSEDEENNYYSLGGDGHNDLEEDNG